MIENTDINRRNSGRILLSTQILADGLDDMSCSYVLNAKDTEPILRGFELYNAQTEFSDDIIYVLAKGKAKGFPIDKYPYISTDNVFGLAPHIRSVKLGETELINAMINIFERYRQFESEINDIVINNGSLNDLCMAGSKFFKNPMYIHDRMFAVIALPEYKEGMLQFEYSENGDSIHIPLWLVNEFKFDDAYNETLKKRKAGIWGKDQYPRNMQSLYVNLWEEDYYYGRLLINELDSPLKPGQFRLAEIFSEYVKMILRRDMLRPNKYYRDYEDTIRTIIRGEAPNPKDVSSLLEILNWRESDSYICLKLQSQNPEIQIKSDSALRSKLTTSFPGSFDFFHEQRLCMIINSTHDKIDNKAIKSMLASLVRDSHMYCGISYPISGIKNIHTGFSQADIALQFIKETRNRWLMSFNECALDYMISTISDQLPVENLVAPELLLLHKCDAEKNTDYYNTLHSYLKNERSIPRTSEELIIHRTTLQYRLDKIKKLTELDLENENTRLYLMLSYKMLTSANS